MVRREISHCQRSDTSTHNFTDIQAKFHRETRLAIRPLHVLNLTVCQVLLQLASRNSNLHYHPLSTIPLLPSSCRACVVLVNITFSTSRL